MKRFLLSAAIALASCNMNPAYAADLPVKAPYQAPLPITNWQGLYLDGYFQYGANVTGVTTIATTNPAVDLASAPRGPGVGGSLGYNFDLGNFVLGARGDISYLNVSGSGTSVADSLSVSNATNYLGNLDVLVGLPISADRRLLVYGVGGFGFGGAKPNLNVGSIQAAASDTSTGWNVGAGLRYKVTQNLGVFIEGDYYQLGDKSLTATDSAGTVLATSLAKYHMVTQKFGLFWQF
jgi:outer membrane immunogenic protein